MTPGGMPMILLADRQTTGGYAKIATVIAADLPRLVQCMPGAKIRFEKVSLKEAVDLYHKKEKEEMKFLRTVGYCKKNQGVWEQIGEKWKQCRKKKSVGKKIETGR